MLLPKLLLLLLLLLLLPTLGLGLDLFEPLLEPEPPAFLSLLGDLDLFLDLDLDLLLDLEQDLPLLVRWPPPRLPTLRLAECFCTVLLSNSSSLVASSKRVLTADSPPKRPSVPSTGFPKPLAAALKDGLNKFATLFLIKSVTSPSQ